MNRVIRPTVGTVLAVGVFVFACLAGLFVGLVVTVQSRNEALARATAAERRSSDVELCRARLSANADVALIDNAVAIDGLLISIARGLDPQPAIIQVVEAGERLNEARAAKADEARLCFNITPEPQQGDS